MIQIAPSILSSDFSNVAKAVREFDEAGADLIHYDVMDGQFVPPITFGAKLVKDLRGVTQLPFEAHLMTNTPEKHFKDFIDAGCSRIIFHAEATSHAHRLCQSLREAGVEAGIAINPATPAEVVKPLLEVLHMILVMTVNPGWGGQKLIRTCLDKVQMIRQWTDLPIEVDGGIDPHTIADAYKVGVSLFVTGSYLSQANDKAEAVRGLRRACEP